VSWIWRAGLVLLGAGALVLRIRHLDIGLDPEEGWFYALSRSLGVGMDRFSPAPPVLGHLLERPLYFLSNLPAAWLGSFQACRAQAAVCAALLAPATALAARRLGIAWPIALAAGAIIAIEEVGTRLSGRIIPGPLAILLALVGLALVTGRERPRLGWVLLCAATLVDRLCLAGPLAAALIVRSEPDTRTRALLALGPAALLSLVAVTAGASADPLWTVPPFGARLLQTGFVDVAFLPMMVLAGVMGSGLLVFALGPAALLIARYVVVDRSAELWQGAVLIPCGVLLAGAALHVVLVELPRWRGSRHGRAVVALGFAVAFAGVTLSERDPEAIRGLPVRFSFYWAETRIPPDAGRPAYSWALRQRAKHLVVAGCPWAWAIHPFGRRSDAVTWHPDVTGYELAPPADAVVMCDVPPGRTPRPDCPWQFAGRFSFVAPGECP
jgi:hypothetical protein